MESGAQSGQHDLAHADQRSDVRAERDALGLEARTTATSRRGTNGIDLPLLFPVTPDANVPDFGFSGNENIDYPWSYLGANPWFQANTTINFSDNLTKVFKSHTIKTGVFFQRARKDQIAWGNFNGQVSFSNCATSSAPVTCADNLSGNAYASALLGDFTSLSQSSSRPIGYFRYTNLEFYVQDTWKVMPRLTLDYGMRFAWFQPQYEARDQLAIFDPASYDPGKAVRLYMPAVGGGAYDPAHPDTILNGNLVGTVIPGSGDLLNGMQFASDGYYQGGWKDRGVMPEPRVGFAVRAHRRQQDDPPRRLRHDARPDPGQSDLQSGLHESEERRDADGEQRQSRQPRRLCRPTASRRSAASSRRRRMARCPRSTTTASACSGASAGAPRLMSRMSDRSRATWSPRATSIRFRI